MRLRDRRYSGDFAISRGVIATTADLMEMILRTPEPGATRLRQAWLRLREVDRWLAEDSTSLSITAATVESGKGVRALKHKLAMDAKARYGKASLACVALGVSRDTFYRWLRQTA